MLVLQVMLNVKSFAYIQYSEFLNYCIDKYRFGLLLKRLYPSQPASFRILKFILNVLVEQIFDKIWQKFVKRKIFLARDTSSSDIFCLVKIDTAISKDQLN